MAVTRCADASAAAEAAPLRPASKSGSEPGSINEAVLLARQPIFRPDRSVMGYELLYRSSFNSSAFSCGGKATATVLMSAFAEVGLERIVGSRRAFVNLPRDFLTGEYEIPPRTDLLVLEVLENVDVDREVVAGIADLKGQGFVIALDDVVYHPELIPLLEFADIVKIDLAQIPPEDLEHHVEEFRRWPVRLLAEKVETPDQFDACKELGFDLFQGFFLSRPVILQRKVSRANSLIILQLLAQLYTEDQSLTELAKTVRKDPAMCEKLLRYINSVSFSIRNVHSIDHAIAMLGNRPLRSLITMMQLAGLSTQPQEVMVTAIIRAHMCRALGEKLTNAPAEEYYLVGLLSTMEALLGENLEDILAEMPLSDEIRGAVLGREGAAGQALSAVLAYEAAAWAEAETCGLSAEILQDAYIEAVIEADAVASCMHS